jgi:hypothetical protein
VGHDQRLVDATKRGSVQFVNLNGGSGCQVPVVQRRDRPQPGTHGPEMTAAKRPFTACGKPTPMVGQRGHTAGAVINVRARISFLASDEGERTADVRSTYRPLHNFGGPDNREMWFGQIRLDANDKISPGESREVLIQFNTEPTLLAELKPGRMWRLQEGLQLVATAKVIEVLDGT